MPNRSRSFGYALVAVAATGWGTWPLVLRHAPMHSSLQSAIAMTVMTVASAPLVLRDRLPVKATLRDWLGVAWLGVSDAANIALFFAAYQRTSVAIAVLTHYLTPIFVALSAPLLLAERLGRRTAAAVAVSFVGLVLLLAPWRDGFGARDLAGAALGAGSAVFYASNVLTNKRLNTVFSASEMMFYHGLIGVPLLWSFVPAGAVGAAPATSIGVALAASLGIGTFCGLAFTRALKRIRASHASVLTLLEPFVAVVCSVVVLGEPLHRGSVAGGLLILGGALAVVTAKHEDGVQSSPS
ncbi:MAG: DMT family transporter [Labilithrix sp.]|nr:DMT family transporter [Labilithrix sp.]MCW5815866.1 DMT family transporter [Labilithrix sp.]